MPVARLAIWRMTPTVPIRFRSLGAGVVGVALLQHEQQHAVAAERPVHRLDRHRPIDRERLNAQRERHGASERQHGNFRRKWGRGLIVGHGVGSVRRGGDCI